MGDDGSDYGMYDQSSDPGIDYSQYDNYASQLGDDGGGYQAPATDPLLDPSASGLQARDGENPDNWTGGSNPSYEQLMPTDATTAQDPFANPYGAGYDMYGNPTGKSGGGSSGGSSGGVPVAGGSAPKAPTTPAAALDSTLGALLASLFAPKANPTYGVPAATGNPYGASTLFGGSTGGGLSPYVSEAEQLASSITAKEVIIGAAILFGFILLTRRRSSSAPAASPSTVYLTAPRATA